MSQKRAADRLDFRARDGRSLKRHKGTSMRRLLAWTVSVSGFVSVSFFAGCVTPSSPSRPSFATDLEPGETDGILIEWRRCLAASPCMRGKDTLGVAYALGFSDSPSVVKGTRAGRPVELRLDPDSVFRLGDHAIEMRFASAELLLAVTWNELEQKLLDHDLVVKD